MLQAIEHISMADVRQQYMNRKKIHKKLVRLLENGSVDDYVHLALGITDAGGNYSADEYQLGSRILGTNPISSVFKLAQKLYACSSVNHIPRIIYESKLSYLKIGVGSEMAMMLSPSKFWVGNVRTIWAHLLIKHGWDYDKANEELELYRDDDITSEMAYQVWRDIYLSMQPNLDVLVELGNEHAAQSGVQKGKLKYLWADAIANALYEYDEEE